MGPFYYLLKEFSKLWVRIDIICPGIKVKGKVYFNNVHLHGTDSSVKAIFKKAKKVYQANQFQVMTVHDYPPFKHSKAAKLIHQEFNVPYLIEIHHIIGYPKVGELKEKLLRIYSKWFLKRATKSAKAIRVVNKDQVPKFLVKAGVDQNKIKYLPSFYLDHQIFSPQNLEKKYDLLFVGRLAKNKGLDLLLEIAVELKKEIPNFKLAITGEGKMKKELGARYKELGLENNIEMLSWLQDAQALAKVYNQSKILLITSYNEGGPRVGLEAMACGTPVISTKVGIMQDVIVNGENGYLVDWDKQDFIEKILKLFKEQDLFSQSAQKSVSEFDYSKMIRDYAEFLKQLV